LDLGFLSALKGQGDKVSSKDLVVALTDAMDKGLLKPGDRLPSIRELSLFLGLAKTTVARAFDQLIATGHLNAQKGSGTFVAGVNGDKRVESNGSTRAVSGSETIGVWNNRLNDVAERILLQSPDFVTSGDLETLNYGSTPSDSLPIYEWKSRIIAQYRADEIVPGGNKTEPFGFRPLREALVGFLRRTKGIQCTASQIVLYSSSQSALNHILSLLVKPEQKAIFENPGFAGASEHFRIHGVETEFLPVDGDGIVLAGTSCRNEVVDWAYITSASQDPTGAVLSLGRRQELLQWISKNGTAIIEDGWDSDFHYGAKTHPTLFSMDSTGSVFYLYTFWRLLYPLTCTTLLVLPPALVKVFETSKRLCDPPFATAEDIVLCELLENGYLEKHIRQVWKKYRKRRQAVMYELTRAFGKMISVNPVTGGMHAIVSFPPNFPTEEIVACAAKCGFPCAPTASYYYGEAPANQFMVFFASIDEADAQAVVERFALSLADAKKQ